MVAVDGVSFTVNRGELFVVMGLSGSGKSTLLRMVNRLVEPTAGELLIEGRDVAAMSPPELRELRNRKVSMVFQHFALFPHRTVRQNVSYGLRVRRAAEAEQNERAEWALRQVGLEKWGESRPDELSGGMRQRVGLARALATDAEILLMDEPFSALDPLIRRDMQDLLLQLQHELRRTVVFVTHDLNEAMRLGDQIMVMRGGKVVQLGTGQEILSAPADEYVSDFVSDVDRSRVLTAGTIMREPVVTAGEQDSPQEVLGRLSNIEASAMYVLDAGDRVLGVADEDRLAQAARGSVVSVGECTSDDFARVGPETPLIDLFPVVGKHRVPLAVTDDGGRLLGVVTRAAVLGALANPERAAHV
ncbi:glycine/betaine ABC transporter ATP-binding protein [Gandjariella thermophila]|uniref:Glycine/betaine ABC transporter ATP-binding protein n=1 Tax=Gandjariella thermophila TaxID=1931992 RepID=A0A4D4IZA3_9PSEU|nr:glycine/betaine ABC transporter ATP-binding protein [Gandjariella thermophila]